MTIFLSGFWKTNLSTSGNDLVIKKMEDRYFATFSCQVTHGSDKSKSRQFKLLKLTGKWHDQSMPRHHDLLVNIFIFV